VRQRLNAPSAEAKQEVAFSHDGGIRYMVGFTRSDEPVYRSGTPKFWNVILARAVVGA